jgi:hypothetical protein
MHRLIYLENSMRIFKKKCKHESCKIIGKFYFREDYRDCIVVHGVIVSQCPNCQKVILDDRYVERFCERNPEERVQHSILALKKAGFLSKVNFQMQHLELKIPFLV